MVVTDFVLAEALVVNTFSTVQTQRLFINNKGTTVCWFVWFALGNTKTWKVKHNKPFFGTACLSAAGCNVTEVTKLTWFKTMNNEMTKRKNYIAHIYSHYTYRFIYMTTKCIIQKFFFLFVFFYIFEIFKWTISSHYSNLHCHIILQKSL